MRDWVQLARRNAWTLVALLALWPLGAALEQWLNPYYLQIVVYIGINVILAVSLNLINGVTGQFSLGHAGFLAVGAYVSAAITLLAWPAAAMPPANTATTNPSTAGAPAGHASSVMAALTYAPTARKPA